MNAVILVGMCLVCGLSAAIFAGVTKFEQPIYSGYRTTGYEEPFFSGFIVFFRSLIFFQNIIPVALYLSLQFVKGCQVNYY